MAKYVVIAFDKDADADRFVESMQRGYVFQAKTITDDGPVGYEPIGEVPHFLRGVYQRPTLFHDPKTCPAGKNSGWTRGATRGWMICASCAKPSEAWARGDSWYAALGVNQLPVSPQAPEYRGMGVPGHYWDPVIKKFVKYEEFPAKPFEVVKGPDGQPESIVPMTAPVVTKEEGQRILSERNTDAA